jgi:hypothetical protein
VNPITINDNVKKAIAIAYPDLNRELIPAMQKEFGGWPLVTYNFGDMPSAEVNEKTQKAFNFVDTIFETPFQKFRFYIVAPWGKYYGIVERHDKQLRTVAIVEGPDRLVLKVYLNSTSRPGIADWNSRAFSFDSGVEVTEGPYGTKLLDPKRQAALDRTISLLLIALEVVSQEYLRPGNFVARVENNKPGKSVVWAKAREHYTIIHRHHEANKKGIPRGALVVSDPNKQLVRIAHSRRAHERVLRSPRFHRDLDGNIRKIKIAEQWVGPDEWKDTAGQTYRIIHIGKSVGS